MPSFPSAFKPLFQTYILPPIPFRRRHSSNTSTSTVLSDDSILSTSPTAVASEPSTTFLSTSPRSVITCSKCHAELALTSQIISKGFTGRHGRAYLVGPSDPTSVASLSSTSPTATGSAAGYGSRSAPTMDDALAAHHSTMSFTTALPNTYTSKPVPRNLVTGLHTVCDVSCSVCASVLGWKYVGAEEDSQRYKVGKFILESRRTVVGHRWDERVNEEEELGRSARSHGDIVFDSADEDECEELFNGLWNPSVARRRRARRVGTRG